MSLSRKIWIIKRLMTRRWVMSVCIFAAAMIFAGPVVFAASIHKSAEEAIVQGVIGQRGFQSGWAIQAKDNAAAVELSKILPSKAVVESAAFTTDRQVDVRLEVVSDTQPALGTLVDGSRPTIRGEATISRAVKDALEVHVGDSIEVLIDGSTIPLKIVGVVIDPSTRGDHLITTVASDLLGERPTAWLTSTETAPDAALNELQARIAVTSVGATIEGLQGRPPASLRLAARLPLALLVTLIVVPTMVIAGFKRSLDKDQQSLVAAGTTPRDAWRSLRLAVVALSTIGVVAASSVALILVHLFKYDVSAWFQQEWVSFEVPWAWVISLALLPYLFGVLVEWFRWLPSRSVAWISRTGRGAVWGPWAGIIPTIFGATFLFGLSFFDQPKFKYIWLAAVTSVLGFLRLMHTRIGRKEEKTIYTAIRFISTQYRPLAHIALFIALSTGLYAFALGASTNMSRSISNNELPDALAIESVDSSAAEAISDTFRSAGGTNVGRYQLPADGAVSVRVTSLKMAECITEAGEIADRCFTPTFDHIGSAAISRDGTLDQPLVEHSLQSHPVAIVYIDNVNRSAKILDVFETFKVDPNLGGNLPSLVLPSDWTALGQNEIIMSDSERVILYDFAKLPPPDRTRIRRLIEHLAPGSLTDGGVPDSESTRGVGVVVAMVGAAISGLVVLLAGMTLSKAHAGFRHDLTFLGASKLRIFSFAWGVFGGLATAAAAGTVSTCLACAAMGYRLTDSGWVWTFPFVSIVLAAGFSIARFALVAPEASHWIGR